MSSGPSSKSYTFALELILLGVADLGRGTNLRRNNHQSQPKYPPFPCLIMLSSDAPSLQGPPNEDLGRIPAVLGNAVR